MRSVTLADAKAAAHKVVAEHERGSNEDICKYVVNGEPWCIIAQVVTTLGGTLPSEDHPYNERAFLEFGGEGARAYFRLDFTADARSFLGAIQYQADVREHYWQDALDKVEGNV